MYFSELVLPVGQLASTFPLRVRVTDHYNYLPLGFNESGSVVKASPARAERGNTGALACWKPAFLASTLGLSYSAKA